MRRTLALALLGTCAGCAAALTEPPSLRALAGHPPPRSPLELEVARVRADRLFSTRRIPDVREAARLWLEIAAADPAGPANGALVDAQPAAAGGTRRAARGEALLAAAEARVWLAGHETETALRRAAARSAVHAAQWCTRLAPDIAACDYWLGAGLGVQARERPSTGLSALPEIVAAFSRAAEADPTLDHGGPDRALALLYLRAPGWPAGPGDADLGLEHAREAVRIGPDHPPNWLALGEARRAVGERAEAREAYTRALDLSRQIAASGGPDAREWADEAEEGLRP